MKIYNYVLTSTKNSGSTYEESVINDVNAATGGWTKASGVWTWEVYFDDVHVEATADYVRACIASPVKLDKAQHLLTQAITLHYVQKISEYTSFVYGQLDVLQNPERKVLNDDER